MRRMLVAVLDMASSLWGGRAGSCRSAASSGLTTAAGAAAAVESSRNLTHVAPAVASATSLGKRRKLQNPRRVLGAVTTGGVATVQGEAGSGHDNSSSRPDRGQLGSLLLGQNQGQNQPRRPALPQPRHQQAPAAAAAVARATDAAPWDIIMQQHSINTSSAVQAAAQPHEPKAASLVASVTEAAVDAAVPASSAAVLGQQLQQLPQLPVHGNRPRPPAAPQPPGRARQPAFLSPLRGGLHGSNGRGPPALGLIRLQGLDSHALARMDPEQRLQVCGTHLGQQQQQQQHQDTSPLPHTRSQQAPAGFAPQPGYGYGNGSGGYSPATGTWSSSAINGTAGPTTAGMHEVPTADVAVPHSQWHGGAQQGSSHQHLQQQTLPQQAWQAQQQSTWMGQQQQQQQHDWPNQQQEHQQDVQHLPEVPPVYVRAASGADYVLACPDNRVKAIPPDVAVIDSPAAARAVVDQLLQYAQQGIQWVDKDGKIRQDGPEQVYFACDTEVAGIDVKTQSPVGHGTVICFSIYAHPQADFSGVFSGAGQAGGVVAAAAAEAAVAQGVQVSGGVKMSRIWVDLAAGWYKRVQQEQAAELAAKEEAAQLAAEAQQQAAAEAAEVSAPAAPAAASRKGRSKASKTKDAGDAAAAPAAAEAAQLAAGQAEAVLQPAADLQQSVAEAAAAPAAVAVRRTGRGRPRKSGGAVEEQAAAAAAEAAGGVSDEAAAAASDIAISRTTGWSNSRRRPAALEADDAALIDAAAAEAGAEAGAAAAAEQQAESVQLPTRSGSRRRPSKRTQSTSGKTASQSWSAASSISTGNADCNGSSGNGIGSGLLPGDAAVQAAEQDMHRGQIRTEEPQVIAAAFAPQAAEQQLQYDSSSSCGYGSRAVAVAAAVVDIAVALEAGSSSSSSSSRSVTGSIGRPAASAVFGEELPAPTVADLLGDPTAAGIIEEFRRFFEAPGIQKVWHNYGFDRHVLEGLGFKLAGFGGDTLHMSRLWDASRKTAGGYSLESLSGDLKINDELRKAFREADVGLPKRGMTERFGLQRLKADGTPAKAAQVPPMHVLHTDPRFRSEWVDYSALDAKATWNVHRALTSLLKHDLVVMDSYLCEKLMPRKPQLQPALQLALAAEKPLESKPAAAATALATKRKASRPPIPKAKHSLASRLPAAAHQHPLGAAAAGQSDVAGASMAAAAAAGVHAADTGAVVSSSSSSSSYTLWDLYCDYWKPFGELLTSMETDGVRVDREHLAAQELKALQDQKEAEEHFRSWAMKYVPHAKYMNVNSQVQIRQMLFPDSCETPSKAFKASNPDYDPNARPRQRRWIDFELHGLWGEGQPGRLAVDVKTDKGMAAVSGAVLWSLVGKPGAAKKALDELLHKEAAEKEAAGAAADSGSSSSEAAAAVGSSIHGDDNYIIDDDVHDEEDLLDEGNGDSGAAAAAAAAPEVMLVAAADVDPEQLAALQAEAARLKLGKMYAAMGGGREGIEACLALEKLIEVSAIDKLLTAFIQPLQQNNISTTHLLAEEQPESQPDAGTDSSSSSISSTVQPEGGSSIAPPAGDGGGVAVHRVHCSLNLNTETGRLSARRPNLQNQPALEKDRYKVRKAFCAAPGRTLVVADYGQLELRLLAHMADCKSMIRAFELGGDFHSRTALGMYDYIQEAIDKGECLLEWDGAHEDGPPPAPLLKDKFASERRKAKILNFSIAYGKTAHGLSKDFGVSLEEAEATVNRWYADRPEVREWQARTKAYAADMGWVNTMLGRRRPLLPAIRSQDKWTKARAERASINTPIQGSAADVASAAMLAIDKDEWLRENGWRLLLQVHDEVMLEGPKETAEEAKARVVAAMANPWHNIMGFQGKPLRVDLVVDANTADTWYEAK